MKSALLMIGAAVLIPLAAPVAHFCPSWLRLLALFTVA